MLKVNNLVAGYGNVIILKNISLEVNKGEVVTILGPNGAGKSTLLHSIVGIIDKLGGHIKEGEIYFNDNSIKGFEPHNLIKNGIAFLPSEGKVFPSMTVLENLKMGGYFLKDSHVLKKNIDALFDIFPLLTNLLTRRAFSLSAGERQLVALARSMVADPTLLILDEPSMGLSPNYVRILFEQIHKISSQRQCGVLMVEQNVKMSLKYSNRGYVIRYGKIASQGLSSELEKCEDIFKLL